MKLFFYNHNNIGDVMNYKIYFLIFLTKIIENSLGTLRLIVVASGKKLVGSILNGVISIIWIIGTGMVLVDVTKDPLKIVFFCLGSIIGSYLGSFMEEKLALGNNLLMSIVSYDFGELISKELRKEKFAVTCLIGNGKDSLKSILLVMTPRKKTHTCVSLISSIDQSAMIISECATTLRGGFNP